MEQSNLLKLAKQGEPDAIAALMNAVLEPRGITARASFEADVLCIVLESPKPLNQDTLVTFIRKGLLELENPAIQRVRAQSKRVGQPNFAWSKEFLVRPTPIVEIVPLQILEVQPEVSEDIPTIANEPSEAHDLKEPEVDQSAEVLGASEEVSPETIEEVPPETIAEPDSDAIVAENESLVEQIAVDEIPAEPQDEAESEESSATSLSSAEAIAELPNEKNLELSAEEETTLDEDEIDEDDPLEPQSLRAWLKLYWRAYSLPVLLVVVGGFIAGGAMAFWSTSKPQNQDSVEDLLQPREQTASSKQTEAEKYLKAMNKAQEEFFQKNKRFANSLEELERSANLIAQSYSYAYRLRVTEPEKAAPSQRSIITASPREADLKSYVGAVFVLPSGASSIVCQTPKPSMEAPDTPQLIKKKLGCAPRSTKVQ